MAKGNKIDVVTMELINNSLGSIIDEMNSVVVRTTTSPAQRDIYDFLCGITDAKGETLTEGEESVLHSNVISSILHLNLLSPDSTHSIHPGDMFCTNDPFAGATHLPDLMVLNPIFIDGQLVAWTGGGGHLADVGGRVPGSVSCDCTTSYEEGIRLPTVKIYDRGVRNDAFFAILAANSRLGDEVVDQLEPFMAASRIGERHFLALAKKYGWETLNMYLNELLDYAERRARAEIKALPNGVYEFEDYLDDDGFSSDPIPFHITITVDEDTMTYDFTGTGPQMKAGLNNPLATTKANVYTAFRCLISADIPRNGGELRPLKVIAPEGSAVNPVLPGATGARGVTIDRIHNVLIGAQAKIRPDKMPACGSGIDTLFKTGGYDKKRNMVYISGELLWGGWGGRPTTDGNSIAPPYLNGLIKSCEVQEALYPIRYNQRAFVPDSEGAGKYRGELAMVTEYEFLDDEMTFQLRTDRRRFTPYGLHGGQPGALTRMTLNPDGENRDLGKCVFTVNNGDIFRAQTAGAGGYGNPLERDIEMVIDDVRNEKVSIRRAREAYGVVIHETTMQVDMEQTYSLRQAMKKGNTKTNDMVAGT